MYSWVPNQKNYVFAYTLSQKIYITMSAYNKKKPPKKTHKN